MGQHSSGLIDDDHFGMTAHNFSNFDQLPVLHINAVRRIGSLNMGNSYASQGLFSLIVQRLFVDGSPAGILRVLPQSDVLGYRYT
ncbi:hypothetical protein D3C75_805170 [compost metagenome]